MRELPAVVAQLKDVIERIIVQISTPASTWPTPTLSVEPPVSPPIPPQVLSDPDDKLIISKCMDTVYFDPCGEMFAIQFPSTSFDT
ncbi:hypothetical protein CHARACLAT_031640 [Characodon lateralis]|uniref:Uncharacterized protein n=1 Tax=Characodon lateralis TaxID=208331 RepID=A0ABU7DC70_9TELE|nr:hypothetical protein [Characodon lateralis]